MDNDFGYQSSENLLSSKGLRQRKSSLFEGQSNGNANAIPDSSSDLFADYSSNPQSGVRTRRLATWADETDQHIKQLKNVQSIDFQSKNQKMIDNSDNDVIPMIPDIQEVAEYEMAQTVAEPPGAHNQIISFQELDKNLLKHSTFGSLDGIDLTQLTHFCLPESQVKEEDIPWSWDHIMSDITSKLMSESDNYRKRLQSPPPEVA